MNISVFVFSLLCLLCVNIGKVTCGQDAPVKRAQPMFDFSDAQYPRNHRTHLYKIDDYNRDLILRRGYDFNFTIHWNRECDSKDVIVIIFKLLTFKANNKHRVSVTANVQNKAYDINKWSAKYTCQYGIGEVNVHIGMNAAIGAYGLIVQETHKSVTKQYIAHRNIGIIFNPYLKGEVVYMDHGLEEYIENERGTIYMGKETHKITKTWFFGQFELITIDATFFALNKCNLTAEERSNPVEVARYISAISNDYDDWGVLIGRWDGNYTDLVIETSATTTTKLQATSPFQWLGSVAILKQYRETQLPVPYGQCWIFAGVMASMTRTIGIPSRVVTCYSCGHDTDNNIMIDLYLDKNGKKTDKTVDSIWNYHVWINVFMRRDDLGSGGVFNGWQDLDGTPQEKSGTKFQMGPTPVNAVKTGIVDAQFDLPFVFSEVNADIVWWKEDSIYLIETSTIGTSILTKAIGENKAVDITHDYKAKEKSKMERQTLQRIAQRLKINHPSFNSTIRQRSLETKHVKADILCSDFINLGDALPIKLNFKPETWSAYSTKKKSIEYTLTVKTMHYDGHTSKVAVKETGNFEIKNKKAIQIETVVRPEKYEDSADYTTLLVILAVKDKKTGELAMTQKEIEVKAPKLILAYKGQTRDRKYTAITASYTNPLSITAKNCAFTFETEAHERKVIKVNQLKAKSTARTDFQFKTPKKSKDLVLVSFACDQIQASESEFRVYSKSN